MPIKDSGLHAFIAAWAAKVVPVDIWIGLRMQTTLFTYDDSQGGSPLVEETLPVFSYADGSSFDRSKAYLLGATKLSGECLYLKQSGGFAVIDSKCSKMKAFICQWNSKLWNELNYLFESRALKRDAVRYHFTSVNVE